MLIHLERYHKEFLKKEALKLPPGKERGMSAVIRSYINLAIAEQTKPQTTEILEEDLAHAEEEQEKILKLQREKEAYMKLDPEVKKEIYNECRERIGKIPGGVVKGYYEKKDRVLLEKAKEKGLIE